MRRPLLLIVLFMCRGVVAPDMPAADLSKPLTLQQVWSLDSIYTDPHYGVTFHYASVWKPATQFGYVPPGLVAYLDPSGDQNPEPVKGFSYVEGGFPRDRIIGPYTAMNLEGVGFVYSVLPAASPADCEKKAASVSDNPLVDNPGHVSVKIAGRSYSSITFH